MKWFCCCWALLVVLAPSVADAAAPIAYEKFKYGPNWFHVITADLSSPRLSAGTVHSPSLTPVWNLISKKQPIAAITGTFFAPRFHTPVADLLVNGSLVAKGSRGTAVGVGWDGGVRIFDQPFRQDTDWSPYQHGLRGAVRVISNGVVQPNPQAQAFKDSRIWGRAARTGIGLNKAGKVVLFATQNKVTLSEFGKAMKAKGVVNAVSLDGGSSTCLYYRGSMKIKPGRSLSNLFVIMKSN